MRRAKWVFLLAAIVYFGCEHAKDQDYYYIERQYSGKNYRTYYRRNNKAAGRIQTFEKQRDGTFKPINSIGLGNAIEAVQVHGQTDTSKAPRPNAAADVTRRLYILDVYADPQVIVYTDREGAPIRYIPVESPAGLAGTSTGDVYVVHHPIATGSIRISIIDTTNDRVSGAFSLSSRLTLSQRNALAASPDGRRLYIAAANINAPQDSAVLVVDIAQRAIVATIPSTGTDARSRYEGVWVSPDSGLVYAATQGSLVVIDAPTATVSATIALTGVQNLVFQEDGTKAYAANFSRIQEIDVATSLLGRFVNLGVVTFENLALSLDGRTVQAWDTMTNVLKQVDALSMTALPDTTTGDDGAGWITILP